MTPQARGRFVAALGWFASHRSARNVAWNLVGGVSTGVMVVVATPWFVSRLGMDGYGIVGLWLMMQVLMGLLDMGFGATVIKSLAGARAGPEGEAEERDLVRTMELAYWALALVAGLLVAGSSGWIASRWLQSSALTADTLREALRMIALALALQFPAGLYSSGLAGKQAHGRMNAIQFAGNLLRYGGGALALLRIPDVVTFFAAQAVFSAAQTLLVRQALWRLLRSGSRAGGTVRPDLISRAWRFSAGMAVTSIAAVLLANADRIALSKLLTTAELGKYAAAFTASGLLQLGIQPFYRAFFPRYAELIAVSDHEALRREYLYGCRVVGYLVIPVAVVGWAFSPQMVAVWLGAPDDTVASVLRWLLVAITCTGLMWLPAALQQASGWTRLHATAIVGALLTGVPLMVWAIRTYGTVGATTVWLLHGVSGITIELWFMHRRLLVGELLGWYRAVVLPPLAFALPVTVVARLLMPDAPGRWTGAAWAAVAWLGAMGLLLLFFVRGERQARARAGTDTRPA